MVLLPYDILKEYRNRFLVLLTSINNLEQRNISSRETHSLVTDIGAGLLKRAVGLPKGVSKPLGKIFRPDLEPEYQKLSNEFDSVFNDLLSFIGTISVKTKALTVSSRRLKTKFNKVYRVKKISTKVQKTIDTIDEINSLELVYNSELQVLKKKKESPEKQVKDIWVDYTDFRKRFSDLYLSYILYREGLRGESRVIEFKRSFNPGKAEKIAIIIASLANIDSGMLYFGWDEQESTFFNIDAEISEQRLVQLVKNQLKPKLDFLLHKLGHPAGRGILLAIPRSKNLHSVGGRTPVRQGSHTDYLNAEEIVSLKKSRQVLPKGYILLDTLDKQYRTKFKSVKPDYEAYFFLKAFLTTIKDLRKNIVDLPISWNLEFRDWTLDPSMTTRTRIWISQWQPQKLSPEISGLVTLLDKVTGILSSAPFEKARNEVLLSLLKDSSYRKGDKTNHRRCLSTYVQQGNPWNFTDWRYFIEPVTNGLRLYYEEGRQDHSGTPYQQTVRNYSISNLPAGKDVKGDMRDWLVNKYRKSGEDLVTRIINSLEVLLQELEKKIFS
ncbi:MAG: helix-turn-helix domain-containing protein [Candidatus Odinarchaeota archaeon]